MGLARLPQNQLDIFLSAVADAIPKESRELMERAWVSLSSKPRTKPIIHQSGETFVKISSDPGYGIATIFDQDVLIFITSNIIDRINRNEPIGPWLEFQGYEFFHFVGKTVYSGQTYKDLWGALERLHHTFVETNIRTENMVRHHSFNMLSEIKQEYMANGHHKLYRIRLPSFFYENIQNPRNVLSLSKAYFQLTSGVARFLYLYARKSAGNKKNGWTESYESLWAKSGSMATLSEFKRSVHKVLKDDNLPDYTIGLEVGSSLMAPNERRKSVKSKKQRTRLIFVPKKTGDE